MQQLQFSGTAEEDAEQFLERVDAIAWARKRQNDGDWLLQYTTGGLEGEALAWYVGLADENRCSWPNLRQKFAQRWIPTPIVDTAAAPLMIAGPSRLVPADSSPDPGINILTEDVVSLLEEDTTPLPTSVSVWLGSIETASLKPASNTDEPEGLNVTEWLRSVQMSSRVPAEPADNDIPPAVPPKDIPPRNVRRSIGRAPSPSQLPVASGSLPRDFSSRNARHSIGAAPSPPPRPPAIHSASVGPQTTHMRSASMATNGQMGARQPSARQGRLRVLSSSGTFLGYVPTTIGGNYFGGFVKDVGCALVVEVPSTRSLATSSWNLKATNLEGSSVNQEHIYLGLAEDNEQRWKITPCPADTAGDIGSYVQGLLGYKEELKSKVWILKTNVDGSEELFATWKRKGQWIELCFGHNLDPNGVMQLWLAPKGHPAYPVRIIFEPICIVYRVFQKGDEWIDG
ncbi:hypothetical protein FRB94_014555 [Tulasnella sp. JGI-2019a]|nr:hypothetical protein FRB93_010995 [Tulasnella sp. JGI-2019a]KAG9007172.1 hypothetical protein FRB94_014555 [Tulasnella sp. JGI-2019a]